MVRNPSRLAVAAAAYPALPPPITAKSYSVIVRNQQSQLARWQRQLFKILRVLIVETTICCILTGLQKPLAPYRVKTQVSP
jgi:hypothetical protein